MIETVFYFFTSGFMQGVYITILAFLAFIMLTPFPKCPDCKKSRVEYVEGYGIYCTKCHKRLAKSGL